MKYKYDEIIMYLNEEIKISYDEIIKQEEEETIWDTIDKYFIQIDDENYKIKGATNEK